MRLSRQEPYQKTAHDGPQHYIQPKDPEELEQLTELHDGVWLYNAGERTRPFVVERYLEELIISGKSFVVVRGESRVFVRDESEVRLFDRCTASAEGHAHLYVYHEASAALFDYATADVYERGEVTGYDESRITIHGGSAFLGLVRACDACRIFRDGDKGRRGRKDRSQDVPTAI